MINEMIKSLRQESDGKASVPLGLLQRLALRLSGLVYRP
jgi:hypothetical protein